MIQKKSSVLLPFKKIKFDVAFVLISFLFSFHTSIAVESKSPNIVLIVADDLGIGDLSCYENETFETPHIDNLAQNGIKFTNFYSNSPVCSPSRAALLSGKYASSIGIRGQVRHDPQYCFGDLKYDVRLLPQYLIEKEYATALIGKWNLGLSNSDLPKRKGFDLFSGFLDDMVDDYYTCTRNGFNQLYKNNFKINKPDSIHLSDFYQDNFLAYIENQKKEQHFFLQLSFNMVHQPIQAKKKWLDKVKSQSPYLSKKEIKYQAFVLQLDNCIGSLTRSLKLNGLYKNTIILFMSDNGASTVNKGSNGYFRGAKAQMYEGGIKIPFIFSYPKMVTEGSINQNIFSLIDVTPTLLEILNIKTKDRFDGQSFYKNLIDNNLISQNDSFYCERLDIEGQTLAYRNKNWKLIYDSLKKDNYQLYNIAKDPFEERDLKMEYPDIFNLMKDHLDQFITQNHSIAYRSKFHFMKQISYDLKFFILRCRNKLKRIIKKVF